MLTKFTVVALAIASSAFVPTSAEAPMEALTNTNGSDTRELREGCWKVAMAVDLPGYDVGYLKATDPNFCITHCRNTGACDMFTYTDYDGGRCWLKRATGPITGAAYPGAASLIFNQCQQINLPLGKCEMTDHSKDIGAQRATFANACYGICAATSTCTAFTWTPYNGGTCWLKSYVTECKPSATGESGSVPY